GHDALDLACIAYAEGTQLHPQRRRHGLDSPQLPDARGDGGIANTATRVTWGAISLSSSSHLPLMPNSNIIKPVTLPPGRARLSTKPAPTGSGVPVNTIGTVRVACSSDGTTAPPTARMTSGASATNSDACLRKSSGSPAPQRFSPMAFAVVRLMTKSNLVGCSTGISAGFAPRKILSTKSPARR